MKKNFSGRYVDTHHRGKLENMRYILHKALRNRLYEPDDCAPFYGDYELGQAVRGSNIYVNCGKGFYI